MDAKVSDSLQTPLIDDLQIPEAQRRQLLELNESTCRWPVGDPGSPGFFFCGATPMPEKPYCDKHCAVAYDKPATGKSQEKHKARSYYFNNARMP